MRKKLGPPSLNPPCQHCVATVTVWVRAANGIAVGRTRIAKRNCKILPDADPSRNNPLWRDRRISVVTRRDKMHEKRHGLWRSLCLLCIVNRMTRGDLLLMARATSDREAEDHGVKNEERGDRSRRFRWYCHIIHRHATYAVLRGFLARPKDNLFISFSQLTLRSVHMLMPTRFQQRPSQVHLFPGS